MWNTQVWTSGVQMHGAQSGHYCFTDLVKAKEKTRVDIYERTYMNHSMWMTCLPTTWYIGTCPRQRTQQFLTAKELLQGTLKKSFKNIYT